MIFIAICYDMYRWPCIKADATILYHCRYKYEDKKGEISWMAAPIRNWFCPQKGMVKLTNRELMSTKGRSKRATGFLPSNSPHQILSWTLYFHLGYKTLE
jgi:hypothetical protein